jgi:O-antigen ligase
MFAVAPTKEPADYGRVGTAIFAFLCVLAGAGIGWYVYQDGLAGFRDDTENPLVIFLGNLPYLSTISLSSLLVIFSLVLVAVWRTWSIDNMVMIFCAFLMVADVVPALSSVMGLLIVVKLCQKVLRNGDVHWPLSPVVFPILLVLMAYFTVYLQVDKPMSAYAQFLTRGPYIVLGVFLPLVINSRQRLESLIDFMIIAVIVSLGVELLQGIASSATGMIISFAPPESAKFDTPYGTFGRLTGLMSHPNRHSNVCSTIGVIVLWMIARPKSMITPQRRAMLIVVFLMLCVGILFSWSRSGWLSFGLVVMMVPFFRWPHLSPLFIAAGGVIAFTGLSTGVIQAAFEVVRDLNRSSSDFRWHIDHIALQAFFEHPWLGLGVGGEKDYFNAYELGIHNAALQVFAGMGIVGVLAFTSLVGTVIWMIYTTITTALDPRLRDIAIAMGVASLVTVIQGLFGEMIWLKFLWAYIGVLGCLYVINKEDLARRRSLVELPEPTKAVNASS